MNKVFYGSLLVLGFLLISTGIGLALEQVSEIGYEKRGRCYCTVAEHQLNGHTIMEDSATVGKCNSDSECYELFPPVPPNYPDGVNTGVCWAWRPTTVLGVLSGVCNESD